MIDEHRHAGGSFVPLVPITGVVDTKAEAGLFGGRRVDVTLEVIGAGYGWTLVTGGGDTSAAPPHGVIQRAV
jgi:hypothetical protein